MCCCYNKQRNSTHSNSSFFLMTRKKVQTFLEEKDFVNKFLHGKCEEVMTRLPSESVDLIVTSPPYNLRNSTGNGMKDGRGGKWANAALLKGYAEAEYNDNLPHDEYVAWQRQCITEMMRLLKPNGALFYNHKWRVQAGLLQDRADIVSGFPVRQIIIWRRKGGINFNKGYFLPTYEVIYMIAKKDFILAKGANSHGDIWEFGQEQKNEHPAPFPLALIERVISSTNAEIVLDPFMGSGTTALAATKLGRKFVGIELSKNYIGMAQKRLRSFMMEPTEQDEKSKNQNVDSRCCTGAGGLCRSGTKPTEKFAQTG